MRPPVHQVTCQLQQDNKNSIFYRQNFQNWLRLVNARCPDRDPKNLLTNSHTLYDQTTDSAYFFTYQNLMTSDFYQDTIELDSSAKEIKFCQIFQHTDTFFYTTTSGTTSNNLAVNDNIARKTLNTPAISDLVVNFDRLAGTVNSNFDRYFLDLTRIGLFYQEFDGFLSLGDRLNHKFYQICWNNQYLGQYDKLKNQIESKICSIYDGNFIDSLKIDNFQKTDARQWPKTLTWSNTSAIDNLSAHFHNCRTNHAEKLICDIFLGPCISHLFVRCQYTSQTRINLFYTDSSQNNLIPEVLFGLPKLGAVNLDVNNVRFETTQPAWTTNLDLSSENHLNFGILDPNAGDYTQDSISELTTTKLILRKSAKQLDTTQTYPICHGGSGSSPRKSEALCQSLGYSYVSSYGSDFSSDDTSDFCLTPSCSSAYSDFDFEIDGQPVPVTSIKTSNFEPQAQSLVNCQLTIKKRADHPDLKRIRATCGTSAINFKQMVPSSSVKDLI